MTCQYLRKAFAVLGISVVVMACSGATRDEALLAVPQESRGQILEGFCARYDPYEEGKALKLGSYALGDSLASYLKSQDLGTVQKDTTALNVLGEMLEKKYLYRREVSNCPECAFVYNAVHWCLDSEWSVCALNLIAMDMEDYKGDAKNYFQPLREFYCVSDMINMIAEFNPQNESHAACQHLLQGGRIGTCQW